jgi:hypothetical protein
LCIQYCYGLYDHRTGFALDCRHPGDVAQKGRVCKYISIESPVRTTQVPMVETTMTDLSMQRDHSDNYQNRLLTRR